MQQSRELWSHDALYPTVRSHVYGARTRLRTRINGCGVRAAIAGGQKHAQTCWNALVGASVLQLQRVWGCKPATGGEQAAQACTSDHQQSPNRTWCSTALRAIHMTGVGEEQMMMLVSISAPQEDSGATFTLTDTLNVASISLKYASILDLEAPVARGFGVVCTCTALWAARATGD